ncbi:ATP-dependent helicase, partial [Candidatus Woesearchaeota archaeon CG11_big_fil_rev_8_21_14_0_20_57_5]
PDESYVEVRVGDAVVGYLDEAFLERLKPGDIFELGGNVYSYRFSRGMVAYCGASPDRPPTVPQWFSEMLPLSFDLAMEIGKFRRLIAERLNQNMAREEIVRFIRDYLYADETTADSIHGYLAEQHRFSMIPHDRLLLVEIFSTEEGTTFCFHCLAGRRVNHALSHALGFALSRLQSRDVAVGYNDNGFFV